MNAYQMASSAYGSTSTVKDTRGIEYDAFARITAAMRAAMGNDQRFAALAKALSDNRRLWTIIATDVADKDNKLSKELRAQIFYLAEFTLAHTSRVLRREASADSLVEINTMIMRGLRGETPK